MYQLEKSSGDIVINGFENGIADSPYSGIADERNVNIISVPTEAAVSFGVSKISLGSFSGNVVSADITADTIHYGSATGTPVNGMAMVFAGASLPTGVSAGTQSAAADTNVYWIGNVNTSAETFKLYSDPSLSSWVDITADGTGTFATIDMMIPRHKAVDVVNSGYYLIDSVGRVWKLVINWRFIGNITRANANGNGLVYMCASDGTGYLFAFRNALIDYMPTASLGTWTYGWKTMNTGNGVANSHHAILGQDGVVYYCDDAWLGSFFQKSPGTAFDPANAATFTWNQKALALPYVEKAQYLTQLAQNLLIAGTQNLIYPWDRTSQFYSYPIFLSESFGYASMSATGTPNLPRMVTVNTNVYAFVGNRGRIYITNGAQANLYKKVPDFLSGTIEPYFTWGDAGFNKNQLYFSVYATTNSGAANNNYGGLWAIDLDTNALRLVNQLSYGTYAGYCTLFIPLTGTQNGFGFYAGWNDGASGYGVDVTSSTPYSNGEAYINSDMIPIGTFLKPTTQSQVEFKLAVPLVASETVQLYYRQKLSDSFTLMTGGSSSSGTFSGTSTISGYATVNFQQSQWIQIRVVLTSTATTPSYVRLKELRIR